MKKRAIAIMLLTAIYTALSTGCVPPRGLKHPPTPPGAPSH